MSSLLLLCALLVQAPATPAELARERYILSVEPTADPKGIERGLRALGGEVLQRWTIVPACLVRLPARSLVAVRALPGITRVDRDQLRLPAERKALDRFNHASVLLHAQGMTGARTLAPVTIAIVDTGQDALMGGTGRPHRQYYVGGDPKNKGSGGLGGSRLIVNRKLGKQPADDTSGHGTAVASTAAGSDWTNAGPGQAFGARIAGYSVADYPNGAAFDSTIVSAWQAVLADRTRLNIVAANLSYHGSADPQHPTQRALDAAASNGDLLVCAAAGNQGPIASSPGSQACVNGLAVGAVAPDSWRVQPWSSRGPVVGDPLRTYPDLAACTYTLGARPDCEAVSGVFWGTSFAAPQVAGVATLLRAAVPALGASETKAILLASCLELGARNPGLGANDFGAGFLRAEIAMATAKNASMHARGSVSTTTKTARFALSVTQGTRYGVAIAWMRTDTSTKSWSNLDLRVLDGAKELAVSASPRNLAEHLRFVAPRTGQIVAEVGFKSLAGKSQSFGIAASALPAMPSDAGSVDAFGSACPGSALGPGKTCIAFNPLARGEDLSPVEGGGAFEVATEFRGPPGGASVTGFSFFLRAFETRVLKTSLWILDASNKPTVLRHGTMSVGTTPGWYSTRFAAYQVPGGARAFCAVEVAGRLLTDLRPGKRVPHRVQSFARECGILSGPFVGYVGLRVHCGSATKGPAPIFSTRGPPRIGGSYRAECLAAKPGAVAVLLSGLSRRRLGQTRLPLDLGPVGAPGCQLLVSTDDARALLVDRAGLASTTIAVPNLPGVAGATFYEQFLVFDSANVLGLVGSNGVALRVGRP